MTQIFTPENPPVMQTEEGRILAEYIYRQFFNIQSEFDTPRVGRGGLTLSAATASNVLITQTPQKITGYDTQILPEYLVESDLANSVLRVLDSGLWFLAIKGILSIDPHTANYTRGFAVELYNETKNQTYKVIDYASVARYAETMDYTISIPVFIPNSVLGDNFAVYIYSTTVNDIQVTNVNILDFDLVLLDNILVE